MCTTAVTFVLGMVNAAAQPHGRGTMIYGPGHRFEGHFRNGNPNNPLLSYCNMKKSDRLHINCAHT